MGLSSKKQKSKSTETIAPSSFAQPFVTDAAQTLKPAYDESSAVAREYQPHLSGAADYYGDVMGGDYLGEGNPYLDDIVQSSNADITDSVNSQFMPRFGSGYHAKTLARTLGENESKLRFGNYAMERGYQNDAGRNLAGIATTATALPMIPSQGYTQGAGGLLGRYVTGTGQSETKQSGGLLGDLLGAALAAWAGK